MTAEIAIINRHAVALATDSAVTIGRYKVWQTANKLFSLGPRHDIAVMVHGAGDFLGLDWESIVKEYRRNCASKTFKTVADCAADFRTHLLSSDFSRDDMQRYSVLFPVFDILNTVAGEAEGIESPEERLTYIENEIVRLRESYRSEATVLPDLQRDAFIASFKDSILIFARQDENFGAIADTIADAIMDLAFEFFRSESESRYMSGVVFAGFGSDERFPSLVQCNVDGRWGEHLRWWKGAKTKDLNDPAATKDFPIVPFAQDDMSYQFMAGISFDYLTFLRHSLTGVMEGAFNEMVERFVAPSKQEAARTASTAVASGLVASVMDGLLNKVRKEQFLPINEAVSVLPKEEMALLAEALVDITAIKRKVDSRLQSVGGPVDVAVISKGDGFIWMKRKHYFDPAQNHDFFVRKKRLEGDRA